jgi:hypothetical protein
LTFQFQGRHEIELPSGDQDLSITAFAAYHGEELTWDDEGFIAFEKTCNLALQWKRFNVVGGDTFNVEEVWTLAESAKGNITLVLTEGKLLFYIRPESDRRVVEIGSEHLTDLLDSLRELFNLMRIQPRPS